MFTILADIWHEPLVTFHKNECTLISVYFLNSHYLYLNKLGLLHNKTLFKYYLNVLGGRVRESTLGQRSSKTTKGD